MGIYDIGIQCYSLAVRVAALKNSKAKLWIQGRKDQVLPNIPASSKTIWMHVASLGEFEQGKPVIEQLKEIYPHCIVVVTFFSPSGYEQKKHTHLADYVLYLPIDTQQNAQVFIQAIRPDFAIFVKYDLWKYYLSELKKNSIPAILISGIFRSQHRYFQWYGRIFRKMLLQLDSIIVQDAKSQFILKEKLQINSHVYGDTRIDRVIAGTKETTIPQTVQNWAAGKRIIIFGSTWPVSEKMLVDVFKSSDFFDDISVILAPHDIAATHLDSLSKIINQLGFVQLTELLQGSDDYLDKKILLVDTIGHLSALYGIAEVAYVGGGFSGNLHNILEAAAWGIPILTGPKHSRFHEAQQLIDNGALQVIKDSSDMKDKLLFWFNNDAERKLAGEAALRYIYTQQGATKSIINLIKTNYDHLLTNTQA